MRPKTKTKLLLTTVVIYTIVTVILAYLHKFDWQSIVTSMFPDAVSILFGLQNLSGSRYKKHLTRMEDKEDTILAYLEKDLPSNFWSA